MKVISGGSFVPAADRRVVFFRENYPKFHLHIKKKHLNFF